MSLASQLVWLVTMKQSHAYYLDGLRHAAMDLTSLLVSVKLVPPRYTMEDVEILSICYIRIHVVLQ